MTQFEELPFIVSQQNSVGTPPFDTISGLLFGTTGDGKFDTLNFLIRDDTATMASDVQVFPTAFSFQDFTSGEFLFRSFERSGQSRIESEGTNFTITHFQQFAPFHCLHR